MLKHRLIANIIVNKGFVVQSRNFKLTNVIGNAITAVDFFNNWAIDEIVILDVSREPNDRDQFHTIIESVSKRTFVPLTVGGWVRNMEDINRLLKEGADRVLINTEAVKNLDFVKESSEVFGSQCIVISIDVKKTDDNNYEVFIDRGRKETGIHPIKLAREIQELGAGEIFLTSIDNDGSKRGYDLEILKQVCSNVTIPVIAFGGVGKWQDFVDGIKIGKADAVAAANIFHYTQHSTFNAKRYMLEAGLNVRAPAFYKIPSPRNPKYHETFVY